MEELGLKNCTSAGVLAVAYPAAFCPQAECERAWIRWILRSAAKQRKKRAHGAMHVSRSIAKSPYSERRISTLSAYCIPDSKTIRRGERDGGEGRKTQTPASITPMQRRPEDEPCDGGENPRGWERTNNIEILTRNARESRSLSTVLKVDNLPEFATYCYVMVMRCVEICLIFEYFSICFRGDMGMSEKINRLKCT